jgi:hypothetical protein
MNEMITAFHLNNIQLSLKEASIQWKQEWLEMGVDKQRHVLQDWFQ